ITDVHGPRLTNSPNYIAASEWARQKLAGWGLQNARLEPWGPFGRGWSLEGLTVNQIKPGFAPLIAYPKAWSPSTRGTVRGEVVYFDAKTEAEMAAFKGKLKDAIVLLSTPAEVKAHFTPKATRLTDEDLLSLANADEPRGAGRGRRFELTEEQKAAAALANKKWGMIYSEGAAVVIEPSGRGGDGGVVFVQGASMPAPAEASYESRPRPWAKGAVVVPQLVMAVEHYNRLIRARQKGAPVQLEINIASSYHDRDQMGYNVIAQIPGTDLKDEIVMIGAHFDSWHGGTGATDNASGSSVVMEAMRIIQTLGLKPRRTIRIGLWSGEEQGLLGSRAYVAQQFGKRLDSPAQPSDPNAIPQYELKPAYEKFSAYYNLDNGTGKIRGVYMQGNEALRPIFRAWLAPFKDMAASTLTVSNTGGTDHQSFDGVGLPGFQFIQDPVEYGTRTHHTNMDVFDRVQEDDMKQAAIIMASFAYNTAMRDKRLPRKSMPGLPEAHSGQ
ncbi:MAG TPA: M20/M25/M40 family metallo-hydrolase, partial [Blastocatellia bacterium]|nr:M20/M25/M40 family metallo-hydrolase [Blastocatellia bacterium]